METLGQKVDDGTPKRYRKPFKRQECRHPMAVFQDAKILRVHPGCLTQCSLAHLCGTSHFSDLDHLYRLPLPIGTSFDPL